MGARRVAQFAWLVPLVLSIARPVEAEEAARPVLTLQAALESARSHQPALMAARAATELSRSEVEVARAPLLPQLSGTASYQRLTGNFVLRPSALPSNVSSPPDPQWKFFHFWNFGATASQVLFDFGRTQRMLGERSEAKAAAENERQQVVSVEANVSVAFFQAQGARALVEVAEAALENNQRHLEQVQAFVQVGTRPEIDLAQVRVDVANAKVVWIQSKNGYDVARLTLNQAMGVEGDIEFDVEEAQLDAIAEEELGQDELVARAFTSRGDLAALELQCTARAHQVSAARGGYAPTLSGVATVTEAGQKLRRDDLGWNVSAGLFLTWPLFDGGLAHGQVRGAQANALSAQAARDALRQAIRVQVEGARLNIAGARAVLEAAREAEQSARERFALAEGRYQAGVGSIIELGDAQVALSQAAAQRVGAEVGLSAARAALRQAVGASP